MKTPTLLLLTLAAFGTAFGASDLSVLDQVRLNTFRLQAADTSVMLYLGWSHDDKDGFKKAAQAALSEVQALQRLDEALVPPQALKELVGSQVRVLKKQALLYDGIDTKTQKMIESGYEAFNANLRVFYKNLEDVVNAREKELQIPEMEAPLKEEMRTCPLPADAKTYREGVELIGKKKYSQALLKLEPLLKTHADTAFGACVALRISDIYALGSEKLEAKTPLAGSEGTDYEKKTLEMLKDIVEKAPYSPVVFEAFLKWRTLEQMGHHGMSNFSDIPNDEYNRQREKGLRKVRAYQKEHPRDPFAHAQAESFLIQPNIERGGAMGNTNLSFWGTLYSEPLFYYEDLK